MERINAQKLEGSKRGKQKNILKLFFFDTETTGIDPRKDYIIQFGGIFGEYDLDTQEFRELAVINQYINIPDSIQIPIWASKVHGIYKEDLVGYRQMSYYIEDFLEYMLKADFVIGHNVEFDKNMIIWEARRNYCPLDPFKIKWIDTMKPCTWFIPTIKSNKRPKLQELYTYLFGQPFDGAHDAMADIRATKDCFLKLLETTNIYDAKLGLGERGEIRGNDKLFTNAVSEKPACKNSEPKNEGTFNDITQDQQPWKTHQNTQFQQPEERGEDDAEFELSEEKAAEFNFIRSSWKKQKERRSVQEFWREWRNSDQDDEMDSMPFIPLEMGDTSRSVSQDGELYKRLRQKEGKKTDQYHSDQSCHLDYSDRKPMTRNEEVQDSQLASELKLANRWMRFWASNLDGFFLLTIIWAVANVILVLVEWTTLWYLITGIELQDEQGKKLAPCSSKSLWRLFVYQPIFYSFCLVSLWLIALLIWGFGGDIEKLLAWPWVVLITIVSLINFGLWFRNLWEVFGPTPNAREMTLGTRRVQKKNPIVWLIVGLIGVVFSLLLLWLASEDYDSNSNSSSNISNSSSDQVSHPDFDDLRFNDVPEIIEVMVQVTKYVSKETNERIRDRDINSLNMANSNDVKKMLAFFKLQKDSMVEYYKSINYLISLGNQFKIDDPQLQVIWDRLKKVYPAVIEKNIYSIDSRISILQDVVYHWYSKELHLKFKKIDFDDKAIDSMREEFEQFMVYMINTKE